MLLAEFILLLKTQDNSCINHFSDRLCVQILDAENTIIATDGATVSAQKLRIQHPLFQEIILPNLIEGFKQNRPQHIRWIGQLEQFFYADQVTTIKQEVQSFIHYQQQANQPNIWAEKIQAWSRITLHWRRYHAKKSLYRNFEPYLSAKQINID